MKNQKLIKFEQGETYQNEYNTILITSVYNCKPSLIQYVTYKVILGPEYYTYNWFFSNSPLAERIIDEFKKVPKLKAQLLYTK